MNMAKILVVDDSPFMLKSVTFVLEKEGYAVHKVKNGNDALTFLAKKMVDIIITDLEMPNMTGFEFIEQIRADKKYDALPIVILTGKTGKAQQNKGTKLGANAFVGKPFKESDLMEVVNNFFDL